MFTGLIEAVGRVSAREQTPTGLRMRIETSLASEAQPGDSLAVNGVCLTVTRVDATGAVWADIGPETARVSTLGALECGQGVNLERPMSADGRFGGHFVQGHVDGIGKVASLREEGDAHWLTIELPEALEPLLVAKGSVCVDGVSVTVARLGQAAFDVMIIPYTWTHTNMASLRVGDHVNIECDMVGKYVARSLELALRGR